MAAAGQPSSLILDGVSCVRGRRVLFDGLSLKLAAGDAALILGPNGVGKSSLLRMIAGLLPVEAGTLTRIGRLSLASEALPLDHNQSLSVALQFWAHVDGAAAETLRSLLGAIDIDRLADVPVRMLSTGQRKRAALALAFLNAPDILLLDEPVNGLDGESVKRVEQAIAAARARGAIVIAATHIRFALPSAYELDLGAAA